MKDHDIDETDMIELEPEEEISEAEEDQQAESELEEVEQEGEEPTEAAEEEAEPEDVLTVILGDDEPDKDEAPDWVKNLRREHRELKKRNKELEAQITTGNASQELGPKPTLEGMDYDEAKFETALTAWHEQKRELDAQKASQEEENRKAEEAYAARLEEYKVRKRDISSKAKDFDTAEDQLKDIFNPTQQGVLLDAVSDPALMVYALGKNPEKAAKLASERNMVKFVAELARMETKMKVSGVKKPAPEKRIGSTGGVPKNPESRLEKLRAEAEKTGDYSKVTAFKRQMREKAK